MKAVFIGGCDRSGTTLLGAMLGNRPDAVCTPESQFKTDALAGMGVPDAQALPMDDMERRIGAHWRLSLWGVGPEDVSAAERAEGYQGLVHGLAQAYARRTGKGRCDLWVDHTPSNMRYAATLFRLFPDSKGIHLVRDGRAAAASVLPLDWGPNTISWAAHWWCERVSFGLAAERRYGPDRVTRVRFEDLLTAPEVEMRRVCSFLGVDYDPRVLQPGGFAVPAYTRGQHALVGTRLAPDRVSGWKRRLSPREVEIFESLTADMLALLGYTPEYGVQSLPMTAGEQIRQTGRELVRRYARNLWISRWRRFRRAPRRPEGD